jgi:Rrf2 family protein
MKLLTKETDYAVRAIMHLARHRGGFVSSRRIAAAEGIPLRFLRRILRTLIRDGLIVSKEGVAGGVRLNARPRGIRLTDIIETFQGNIQLADCMFRQKVCSNRRTCVLRRQIKVIEKMVTKEFEGITIASLLKDLEVEHEKKGHTHR